MKSYKNLVDECRKSIEEIMPWDLVDMLEKNTDLIMLDVREAEEFNTLHIADSINVPRGLLEGACDYGYDETLPDLVAARNMLVVVICRSGNRSLLAARTMKEMGYKKLASLNTGIRGWNDYEQTLYDSNGDIVDIDEADEILESKVSPEQMPPK